jgi:hypothetical protein
MAVPVPNSEATAIAIIEDFIIFILMLNARWTLSAAATRCVFGNG